MTESEILETISKHKNDLQEIESLYEKMGQFAHQYGYYHLLSKAVAKMKDEIRILLDKKRLELAALRDE